MESRYLFVLPILTLLSGCAAAQTETAKCIQQGDSMASGRLELGRLASLDCSALQEAYFHAGLVYETGDGVAVDLKKAAKWYHRAAASNSGTTQVFVAPSGREKFGSVLDVRIAPRLEGHADAKYRLGLLYLDGRGVKQSRKKAKRWLKRAARQGHKEAAQTLERLEAKPLALTGLAPGRGSEKPRTEAAQ